MFRSNTGLAFAAALVLLVLPASAQVPPARTLTIVGTGEIQAVPDMALVSVGVTTTAKTAAETLQANSGALQKVLDTLRSLGVESKDMQTNSLSLQAVYDHPEKPSASDRPRIIGYSAANQLTVRVRDLSKLGILLDRVTVAGANQIDGIEFLVSDQASRLDQARRQAVSDAKSKADLYAQAAGFALGKIMTVTEEPIPTARPMLRSAMTAAPPVPVEAGEMTLSVRVRVVWALAD